METSMVMGWAESGDAKTSLSAEGTEEEGTERCWVRCTVPNATTGFCGHSQALH